VARYPCASTQGTILCENLIASRRAVGIGRRDLGKDMGGVLVDMQCTNLKHNLDKAMDERDHKIYGSMAGKC
jgi:hypothetical protein